MIATLVSGTATHVLSQAFSTAVSVVFQDQRRNKNTTWSDYVDALVASLSDPTGWFMVMLSSGVHLGAQVKVANAAKAQAAVSASPQVPAPKGVGTAVPDGVRAGSNVSVHGIDPDGPHRNDHLVWTRNERRSLCDAKLFASAELTYPDGLHALASARTSAMSSISTQEPNGTCATPKALRL